MGQTEENGEGMTFSGWFRMVSSRCVHHIQLSSVHGGVIEYIYGMLSRFWIEVEHTGLLSVT